MLVESARAVDNDIVGSDSVAAVIPPLVEFKNACSCALLAASKAAAAVWYFSLSFELEEEKKDAILEVRRGDGLLPPFSVEEKDGQGIGGELLRIVFDNRRGIVLWFRIYCLSQ